jgi:hypothetical protein
MFPFTVATIDMNWHPSNTNGRNFFQGRGKKTSSEFYHTGTRIRKTGLLLPGLR